MYGSAHSGGPAPLAPARAVSRSRGTCSLKVVGYHARGSDERDADDARD